MQKVVEFYKKNPVQYLATVGKRWKGKMPPIHVLVLSRMESFGSCTNNIKGMFTSDMLANPEVEVSADCWMKQQMEKPTTGTLLKKQRMKAVLLWYSAGTIRAMAARKRAWCRSTAIDSACFGEIDLGVRWASFELHWRGDTPMQGSAYWHFMPLAPRM